jgi:hypothetical protein
MNFNFGEVLTRAWQIIWKHKVLWIFGILAGCGSNGTNFNYTVNQGDFGQAPNMPPQAFHWFQTIQDHITAIIAVTLTVLCLFWIIAIFLNTIGKIGLIRGTVQADGGAEKLVFGELFSGSIPYFWRIFGLNLIFLIPVFILTIIVIVIAFGSVFSSIGGGDRAAFGILAMLPFFFGCMCLFIPVMFVVGMIFRQAENAIVLDDLGVLPALSRGWQVFKSNLGPIIVMTIILVVIGFMLAFVIAIPIMIIVFPSMIAFFASGGRSSAPLILMGICTCLFVPVGLTLRGIITSYTQSAWTLTYLRLTQKPEDGNPSLPEDNHPIEPEDSNRTIIASRPNA